MRTTAKQKRERLAAIFITLSLIIELAGFIIGFVSAYHNSHNGLGVALVVAIIGAMPLVFAETLTP